MINQPIKPNPTDAATSIHAGLVHVDWSTFDPWCIQSVQHRLAEHPLMKFGPLTEVGQRLDHRRSVRTHSDDAGAGTPFNAAPRLHPNRMSAADTFGRIRDAKAWTSQLSVQGDALYRTLVDEVLDGLKPGIERHDPGMCYCGGWMFVTSPGAVTPFHFDREHNFILQVSGRKTLYVWDHHDVESASERSRDRFHATHQRDLLMGDEAFRQRARVFHLEPRQGAHMPSTSPHIVENGEGPSVTISFTYYTNATRRNSLLQRAHERLRKRGVEPPAVGANLALDALLWAGFNTATRVRSWMRAPDGERSARFDGARYAFAGQV